MSDLLYQIAFTKISGIGPKTGRQIVSYCGGIKEVFNASKQQLAEISGIRKITLDAILNKTTFKEAEDEIKFLEKNKNIQPLFYLDPKYPQRLTSFKDAPLLLYYQGNTNLNHKRTVAIVGTRKPSELGKKICEKIIEDLQNYNVVIISGLAYGIDITSHQKCVDLKIPTIACLGHGLQMIYPSQHKRTAQQMIQNGGLLTEFTSKEKPDAAHFPMRNRIIAGLCDALIVIETAKKGGSMITAEIGNAYHKDVFAVPGRLNDEFSQGCNFLIKTHKAQLIESAEDIGYIMRWEKGKEKRKPQQKSLFIELNDDEKKLIEMIHLNDSISIDSLSYQTGWTHSRLASLLLDLEFKGLIKSLPGKRYILIA